MEIRYEPSRQDLVESGLEAFRTNKVIRRNTMVSNGLCAFLFGALLYYSFDDFTFSLACLLCGAVACVLYLLFLPKTLSFFLRRRSKKFVGTPAGKTSLTPRTVCLNSKGVRIYSDGFDKLYPYANIVEIRLKKDYLILPLKDGTSLIVPLRAFESPQQQEQFLAELRSHRPAGGSL